MGDCKQCNPSLVGHGPYAWPSWRYVFQKGWSIWTLNICNVLSLLPLLLQSINTPDYPQLLCNNLGVITMLTTMQHSAIVQPNDTTVDDCNLYQILVTNTYCPNLSFQYLLVKGHQDNDSKWHFTVAEQCNVDCDQLAKQYVISHPTLSIKLGNPEMAAVQPHLLIEGKVIWYFFIPALW